MEKICILLSTYNGEKFLSQQLDSILNQDEVKVYILIRDDFSSDSTVDIIKKYNRQFDNVFISSSLTGKNLGVAKSYLCLMNEALKRFKDINYFFFADQDDFWKKNKCLDAVKKIELEETKIILYYSKKILCDSNLIKKKREDEFKFRNNIWDYFDRSDAYGCTMCLTRKFVEIIAERSFNTNFYHDAYIYRLAVAMGIPIKVDYKSKILYRQHANNAEGYNKRNLKSAFLKIIKRREHYLQKMTKDIYNRYNDYIPKKNLQILKSVMIYNKNVSNRYNLIKLFINGSDLDREDTLLFISYTLLDFY